MKELHYIIGKNIILNRIKIIFLILFVLSCTRRVEVPQKNNYKYPSISTFVFNSENSDSMYIDVQILIPGNFSK